MAGMSSPNSPTYTPSGTTPTAGGKGPASTTAGGYGAAPTAGVAGAPAATGKGPATTQSLPSSQYQPGQYGRRGQQRQQPQAAVNQPFTPDALRQASQQQYDQYQQNLHQFDAQRAAAAGQQPAAPVSQPAETQPVSAPQPVAAQPVVEAQQPVAQPPEPAPSFQPQPLNGGMANPNYGRGGKGFRSGGAVREISEKDINQILNALRVAREVVIKGK